MTSSTTDVEEGRVVVVDGRKARVLATGDNNVRVSFNGGGVEDVPKHELRRWPVLDIAHPLEPGTLVRAIPPNQPESQLARVQIVGASQAGLAYLLESKRDNESYSVAPGAIIEAK